MDLILDKIKSNLIITTPDLILSPINLHDQIEIAKNLTHEVCELMDNEPFRNWYQTLAFVKYHIQRIENGKSLTLIARQNNQFVGLICLDAVDTKVPSFGIWVATHQQRKTFGKQMVQALYNWALEQNRYDYLLYPVIATNIPSRCIIEFIGGHYLYHKQEFIKSDWHTLIYYHLPTVRDLTLLIT